MEIYLIRHTETVCEKGVCYGQSDVGILEPYRLVFDTVVDQLPKEAVLYSSPLQRCVLLAKYIQEHTQIDIVIEDSRLMEMDFGDWELQKWNDIPREILDPWMEDFVNVRVPNGESFVDVNNRVLDFFENEIPKGLTKPIIIVAHSGVIRSILCKINDRQLKDAFQNTIDFGEVIKIEI
ncbi:alpha-ribazole phosphatase [Flavobacterium adhaerens]|uniref:alpha-ribazole phosphatase n=1 Tax=Flavobacterium adhaerens TaxID=3149043 RepID=UPI0032B50954